MDTDVEGGLHRLPSKILLCLSSLTKPHIAPAAVKSSPLSTDCSGSKKETHDATLANSVPHLHGVLVGWMLVAVVLAGPMTHANAALFGIFAIGVVIMLAVIGIALIGIKEKCGKIVAALNKEKK